MKRDRGEPVEREGTEVQQRRLGARHPRNPGWRGVANRKETEFPNETFHSDTSYLSMEFDIQREMVGAVIGKGGGTARSIRSRTGASVHVHSPQNENARTFVELRGRREQIESAFEELRTVVASVDEDYAKQMHASVSLRTKPENVGCLIGKQGQNIKQIEEETRARVRVERTNNHPHLLQSLCHLAHEEGEEFQCVFVSGEVGAVEVATRLVQESLDRYDASRGKKTYPPPPVPRATQPPSKPVEQPKAPIQQEMPTPQPEPEATVPPILIQAPAGGFGPHPAILVLQADGTYHPAQLVTAVDGNLNAAGLVSILQPQAAVPSYLPSSQPLDVSSQRALPTGYPQQNVMQQPTAPSLMQQVTSVPMTQAVGMSPMTTLNFQQFPPQLYSMAPMSGPLASLSSVGTDSAQLPATSIPHGLHTLDPTSNFPPAS